MRVREAASDAQVFGTLVAPPVALIKHDEDKGKSVSDSLVGHLEHRIKLALNVPTNAK